MIYHQHQGMRRKYHHKSLQQWTWINSSHEKIWFLSGYGDREALKAAANDAIREHREVKESDSFFQSLNFSADKQQGVIGCCRWQFSLGRNTARTWLQMRCGNTGASNERGSGNFHRSQHPMLVLNPVFHLSNLTP